MIQTTLKKLSSALSARTVQFVLLPLVVLGWFALTDPSGGADTLLRVQLWAQAILVTGMSYLISKSLLGRTSSESLYRASLDGNQAAGLAYLGVCVLRSLVLVGLLTFFAIIQQ